MTSIIMCSKNDAGTTNLNLSRASMQWLMVLTQKGMQVDPKIVVGVLEGRIGVI